MTLMRNALLVLPLTVGFAAAGTVQKQDEDALAAKVAQANAAWRQARRAVAHRTNGRPSRERALKAVAHALICQDYVAHGSGTASMVEIPSDASSAVQAKLEDSLAAKQLKPLGHAALSSAELAALCGGQMHQEFGALFTQKFQDSLNKHNPDQPLSTSHQGWYPNEEDEYYVYGGHNEEPEQYYYYHSVHPTVDHWNMAQNGLNKIPPKVMTMAQNPRRTDTKTCQPSGVGAKLLIRCCSYNVRELVVPMDTVATKTVTYEDAMNTCQSAGYRMCTLNEVLDGRACAADGCGSGDSTLDPKPTLVWTSTPCEEVGASVNDWKGPTVPPPEGHLTEKQLRLFMDGLRHKQAELTKSLHKLIENSHKLKAHSLKLPFEANTKTRTVELNDWNLAIYSSSRTPGTGCLIVGLGNNARKGDNCFVAGEGNQADGQSVTVAGGWNNVARGHFSAILGGKDNIVEEGYAVVAGGVNNTAERAGAVVSGGSGNIGNGEASVVSGGFQNVANGAYSQVGGGFRNTAAGESATVTGGTRNMATGQAASVTSGSDQVAAGEQYR